MLGLSNGVKAPIPHKKDEQTKIREGGLASPLGLYKG
jgi:hypothetical protein